jgi:uncharacterized protein YjbJ (UPF0337 family)
VSREVPVEEGYRKVTGRLQEGYRKVTGRHSLIRRAGEQRGACGGGLQEGYRKVTGRLQEGYRKVTGRLQEGYRSPQSYPQSR